MYKTSLITWNKGMETPPYIVKYRGCAREQLLSVFYLPNENKAMFPLIQARIKREEKS